MITRKISKLKTAAFNSSNLNYKQVSFNIVFGHDNSLKVLFNVNGVMEKRGGEKFEKAKEEEKTDHRKSLM